MSDSGNPDDATLLAQLDVSDERADAWSQLLAVSDEFAALQDAEGDFRWEPGKTGLDGVITMGLPPTAELAWRWTDAGSWLTKRDANEPSFAPKDVIADVSPLPLYMIQSTKDEYVSKAEWERLLADAREPKKQILIDATNHRFTDKRAEVGAAYVSGLGWIAQTAARRSH